MHVHPRSPFFGPRSRRTSFLRQVRVSWATAHLASPGLAPVLNPQEEGWGASLSFKCQEQGQGAVLKEASEGEARWTGQGRKSAWRSGV